MGTASSEILLGVAPTVLETMEKPDTSITDYRGRVAKMVHTMHNIVTVMTIVMLGKLVITATVEATVKGKVAKSDGAQGANTVGVVTGEGRSVDR